MTNEERDLISAFIQRVGGQPARSGFAGSVPPTTPPLPPVEPEADAFIAEQFARFPEARYRITQMAFVQEHALVEAQNQINRLQWELTQAQQAAQQAQQAGAVAAPQAPSPWGAAAAPMPPQPPQPSRSMFGGLFGRQTPPAYPPPAYPPQGYPPQGYGQQPPPPQYAPGYQPGMFQRGGGSGFLGSALTTAAGVAGGMVAGNALMNLFSHHNSGGGTAGGGLANTAASPWASPASTAPDPFAIGGAPKDSGWTDASTPAQPDPWSSPTSDPAPADSGWLSPTSDPGQDSGDQDAGWSDPDPGDGGSDWSDSDPV
jgi:hypothetical protein